MTASTMAAIDSAATESAAQPAAKQAVAQADGPLCDRRCVPCNGDITPMPRTDVDTYLANLNADLETESSVALDAKLWAVVALDASDLKKYSEEYDGIKKAHADNPHLKLTKTFKGFKGRKAFVKAMDLANAVTVV